jgi:hypothetical protein
VRRAAIAALGLSAVAGLGLAAAATRWSMLLLDAPGPPAALVVQRDAAIGMRPFDSACRLCARQRPGSPLHSVLLPPSYCPLALAAGPWLDDERVLLRVALGGASAGRACASF